MSNLVKLSPQQANLLFYVPQVLSQNPQNSFYATLNMPNSGYDDGPWPLLAFLKSSSSDNQITVQVCTLHEEFFEFDDFNPLLDPFCGYIVLNKSNLLAFIRLLREHGEQTSDNVETKRDNFELIEQSKYDHYHLKPQNHPKTFRFHWRLPNNHDSIIQLVTISYGTVRGPYVRPNDQLRFNLEFREFSEKELSNGQFTPLDEAPSFITLNRNELLKLALILEDAIVYIENNRP